MPRGKAWKPVENVQLTKSWRAISEDPVTGNEQKLKQFWQLVYNHWSKKIENVETVNERSPISLKSRWQVISASISKFVKYWKRIVNLKKSGTCYEDWIRDAKELYQQNEKSAFEFQDCWECVNDSPKFHSQIMKSPKNKKESAKSSDTLSSIEFNENGEAFNASQYEIHSNDEDIFDQQSRFDTSDCHDENQINENGRPMGRKRAKSLMIK